jgi:hypothetical protein
MKAVLGVSVRHLGRLFGRLKMQSHENVHQYPALAIRQASSERKLGILSFGEPPWHLDYSGTLIAGAHRQDRVGHMISVYRKIKLK